MTEFSYQRSLLQRKKLPGDTTLGDRLRAAREAKGINKADLARLTGLSKSYVGRLESGKQEPSRLALDAIARALGVTVTELLSDKPVANVRERPAPYGAAGPSDPGVTSQVPERLQRAVESLGSVPADMSAAILEHLTKQVELLTSMAAMIEELRREIRGSPHKEQERSGPATRRQSRKRAAG